MPTNLTLRNTKGTPLTHAEMDANLSALDASISTKADQASPALTGTPTAPTAAVNTSTTQLATTAFVLGQAATTTPVVNGTAAVGTGTTFARADHVHGSDTTKANLASPTFTGTPAAPTAAVATNTTQIATTAYVKSQAATTTPAALGTAAVGTGTTFARADHVHAAPATTLSGDITGTGTGTVATTLAASGVTAGTYNNSATAITPVTFDAKGRATATGAAVTITPAFASVTNKPTSVAGYGITDALTTAQLAAANGVASLDATGKVPSTQLPSYVDDVLEFANLAALPATGEAGKIYVALDTNKTYRWGGTSYVYITSGAVDSVAGKTGVVTLNTGDVAEGSNLYYTAARASAAAPVQSVAGRTGAVTLTKSDVGLANVDNTSDAAKPISTATQTALDGKQPLDGDLTAIAALAGTTGLLKKTAADTWSLDTTAYITSAGAPVQSVAGRTGAVTLAVADVSGAAPLASPALTGTPTAPTAATNTSTTQLATTAFVLGQASSTAPLMDGTAAVGTGTTFARADHVHGSDTTKANLASPTFTGTPAAPTAAVNTSTTQLATTAYVIGQAASTTPAALGTAAVGTGTTFARADHVHTAPSTTLSGDVTGTGTGSVATTLANSGVTAGTYVSVTVDAKGRATSGSTTQAWSTITGTPTTVSGYGITDALTTTGNSLPVTQGVVSSATLTTSATTANQVADTLAAASYRTVKYLVQATSGTSYHATELLLIHDGTTVHLLESGTIFTGASLSTFDADINTGNIRLLVTPTNAATTYKVIRTAVNV